MEHSRLVRLTEERKIFEQHTRTPLGHERCETGKHWNTKERKCLPLPPELEKMRKNSRAWLAHAQDTAGKADKLAPYGSKNSPHHSEAQWAYNQARIAHLNTARNLAKAGFDRLVGYHTDWSETADWGADRHSRRADPAVTRDLNNAPWAKDPHLRAPGRRNS